MAVIQLDTAELSDVVDVLSQRGVDYVIIHGPDGAFLYGSEDTIQQINDILWARDVIQETDFHQGLGVSYAISVQNR